MAGLTKAGGRVYVHDAFRKSGAMADVTNEHPHLAVARALSERLVAGDAAGVAALYADDVVVWRNVDNRELSKKQVLKVIGFLTTAVKGLRYENIRVVPTPDGFVQQHTLCCVAPNGTEVATHACLVAILRNGAIARLDEYFDAAQLAPLMGG
jgi:ketosteroid isomerase-like protein